jgi:Asp-tRNA(Asn)/Glu-tRNA(Gln) amidotransferase C subunit
MDKGVIQTKEEYRMFIGKLEQILAYLTKMDYKDVNAASGKPLWKAISTEMQRDVAKELAHNKKLKKTKDGKALVICGIRIGCWNFKS